VAVMDTELKGNLRRKQTWLRGLYMLLFVVLYHVAEFVVAVVAVLQFLFCLVSGKTNENLLQFADGLSRYAYQILRFLMFNDDSMPFPFAEWPGNKSSDE
jgi:hypothetical protein